MTGIGQSVVSKFKERRHLGTSSAAADAFVWSEEGIVIEIWNEGRALHLEIIIVVISTFRTDKVEGRLNGEPETKKKSATI